MSKSGIGVGVAASLLAALTLGSCGRSASEEPASMQDDAGQGGAGEPPSLPQVGGETANAGGSSGGDDPTRPEGGFPSTGGAPAEQPCEPDARHCDGPSVRVCDDDGIGSIIVETCKLSQACSAGECLDIDCVPGATFCHDSQVLQCNDSGTDGEPVEHCAADQYCIEQDGAALCSDSPCLASEPMCLNQVATTCKPDGSGPAPGGVNCATLGRSCFEGECVEPSCTPGEKLCQHDDVYICIGGGAEAVVFAACGADESCDPELVSCRSRVCEPGKLGCDAERVAQCNALGLGWVQSGTDCSTTGQLCVDGTCKTEICVPSSTFCKDGDVYLCDAYGVSASLSQTCSVSYHCAPYYYYPNTAYCVNDACAPGAALCNGNVLTTCAADGSGPLPGGSDCGSEQVCSNNACVPKICVPYQGFCQDGDVYYCEYNGLSTYKQSECGADARCAKDGNDYLTCVPYDCSPGLKACLENQVGTCADDGGSLSTLKQDCTATGDVCTGTSACGATAVDTLGAADELQSATSGYLLGDIIDVTSNRQLTLVEANLVLAGSRDLRWVVYELVNGYYEARYDKLVEDQSGSGYLSSGPVSYTLKAGRRYVIGVAVTGGGFVPYYDSKPWQPELSFGRAAGSMLQPYATTLYGNYTTADLVYDLRFTTELP